jgi:uncharacterized protein YerC
VKSIKEGLSNRELHEKHGVSAETVRHVRRFMIAQGWTAPKRDDPKPAKSGPGSKPPRPRMTGADLLRKYPAVVRSLRKGKTMKQTPALRGVSTNTVRVVKRALVAQGGIP